MATPGFGFAEAYVQRKLYKEKLKLAEEDNTQVRFHGSEAKTSTGCFFWLSKNQRKKTARITDHNEGESGTPSPNT